MSLAMCAAARSGDVVRVAWCYAHKGRATWADPNNHGKTPLHVAILTGHSECVAFLLLNGGDLHQADADGQTPLCLGAEVDQPEVAQLILEKEQAELL